MEKVLRLVDGRGRSSLGKGILSQACLVLGSDTLASYAAEGGIALEVVADSWAGRDAQEAGLGRRTGEDEGDRLAFAVAKFISV